MKGQTELRAWDNTEQQICVAHIRVSNDSVNTHRYQLVSSTHMSIVRGKSMQWGRRKNKYGKKLWSTQHTVCQTINPQMRAKCCKSIVQTKQSKRKIHKNCVLHMSSVAFLALGYWLTGLRLAAQTPCGLRKAIADKYFKCCGYAAVCACRTVFFHYVFSYRPFLLFRLFSLFVASTHIFQTKS